MVQLRVALTVDVVDKQTALTKLQQLKDKVKGTGIKLSASWGEMLEKPTDQ